MSKLLLEIAGDEELCEVARREVEKVLLGFREDRISLPYRANGLVIKERDGTSSDVIRLGMESAFSIALKAVAEHRALTAESKITIKDSRFNFGVKYKTGHGTTTAGIMRAIAAAIENPYRVVEYIDYDSVSSHLEGIVMDIGRSRAFLFDNIKISTNDDNPQSIFFEYKGRDKGAE